MNGLTRISLVVSVMAFAMIFVAGGGIQSAVTRGWVKLTPGLDAGRKAMVLGLFFLFAMGLIPGFISLFVHLQDGIGNSQLGVVRMLSEHQLGITIGVWAFMTLGLLIALPVMTRDMLGVDRRRNDKRELDN